MPLKVEGVPSDISRVVVTSSLTRTGSFTHKVIRMALQNAFYDSKKADKVLPDRPGLRRAHSRETFRAFGPYERPSRSRSETPEQPWSSRQRKTQVPVVGPANCFATRCGRSRIRIQSGTKQLFLPLACGQHARARAHPGGTEKVEA